MTENVDRHDAWVNAVTGFGTNIDKVTAATIHAAVKLSDQQLEDLFGADDLARKIVLLKPMHMLRKGYTIDTGEQEDEDKLTAIVDHAEAFKLDEMLFEAMWRGRLYGGSLLVFAIANSGDPHEPLPETGGELRWLKVVDKREVHVESRDLDINSPNFGQPLIYRITPMISDMPSPSNIRIHHSRVVRFGGAITDPRQVLRNAGWDNSVLQEAYDVLLKFSQAWDGVSYGLTDWSQAVFKLHGLIQMIAQKQKDALQNRMAVVNMSRSVARAVLLDAEKESFERHTQSFAGLDSILDRFMMRLSAVADVPVTILFGRSPAGMNATGESDFRNFYDGIGVAQTKELLPALKQSYRILFDHSELEEPDNWSIKFNTLWELTAAETAEVRLKNAQADQIYIQGDVVLPEEVALSRFTDKGYDPETQIDRDLREESLNTVDVDSPADPLLTPTDNKSIITVEEARASLDPPRPPFGDERDAMIVSEYIALLEAKIAKLNAPTQPTGEPNVSSQNNDNPPPQGQGQKQAPPAAPNVQPEPPAQDDPNGPKPGRKPA